MIFEQYRTGGCLSYLVGCEQTRTAALIDPEVALRDRYLGELNSHGLRLQYVIDTHTHADHFSASREIARQAQVPVVMHRSNGAPFVGLHVEEGDTLLVGELRARVLYTPGHTSDSMSLVFEDRVFTGDALLIGSTGRTDLPTGDPAALHASLFDKLMGLPDALLVFPAHDYKGQSSTTIGKERSGNPRLQLVERDTFVAQMKALSLGMPTHLTEALRTNRTGGKSVGQLIAEAAKEIPFMGMADLLARVQSPTPDFRILDVREKSAFDAGHIEGAIHLARGQLELRVDQVLPDPSVRILVYCELGRISTLATATLRSMGFLRAAALDGGFKGWVAAGHPVVRGQPGT